MVWDAWGFSRGSSSLPGISPPPLSSPLHASGKAFIWPQLQMDINTEMLELGISTVFE